LAGEHVIRHDYAPGRISRAGSLLGDVLGDVRIRRSAVIVGAALAVTAASIAVELHRLAAVDAVLAAMSERTSQTTASRERLAAQQAEVVRMQLLADTVLTARSAARDEINALVLLGNQLPLEASVTRVHGDRDGSWTIDGRASRIFAVRAALLEAAHVQHRARIRLLSLSALNARTHGVRFTLSWERPSP
jgi:hypothetical protein